MIKNRWSYTPFKKPLTLLLTTFFLLSPFALAHECTTPFDELPDYCEIATTKNVISGPWSSSATWAKGKLPSAGDVVEIIEGTDVVVDTDVTVKAVCIHGELTFSRIQSVSLKAETVFVHVGGFIDIGTENDPIPVGVKAQIVILDRPIDTNFDPKQYLNGLVVMGKIRMHGAVKSPTFVRLATEPKVGDQTLTLSEEPSGWQVGDQLMIPDTTEVKAGEFPGHYPYQPEISSIQSISGRTVTLTSPLTMDHPGAIDADGTLRFLSHVGNLSHNVIVRSENPAGVRGHTLLTHRADVDIRYSEFKDLGRTTVASLDNTTFDDAGNVTHIGTNQIGRYALHLHHVWGASNPTGADYVFKVIGNSVVNGKRWAMTIHDSHWGLIKDNVVSQVNGAGIVTETGNEINNEIIHNFIVGAMGDPEVADDFHIHFGDDEGIRGLSMWLKGPHNILRDNVTANARRAAYYIGGFGKEWDTIDVPAWRGADVTVEGEHAEMRMDQLGLIAFERNEAYASFNGFYPYRSEADILIADSSAWNIPRAAVAPYYEEDHVKVRGLIVRGARAFPPLNHSIGIRNTAYAEIDAENVSIEGVGVGVQSSGYKFVRLKNADLKCINDVEITFVKVVGELSINSFENVMFGRIPGYPLTAILMASDPVRGWFEPMQTFVRNYNNIPGRDLQVFLLEQHPDFVIPNEDSSSLCQGLTNTQCWERYSLAVAGEIASSTETTPEIVGYVKWLDATPPALSSISAGSITTSDASISWTTNEESDSKVYYGPTASYGSSIVNGSMAMNHLITLTGLNPGMTYHYKVESKDAAGNTASSADFTFQTAGGGGGGGESDTTAPAITGLSVTRTTSSAAFIAWTTNEAAAATLEYGLTRNYGSTNANPRYRTSGTVKIGGLLARTTYHYRLKVKDRAGNETVSADYTFTTI